MTICDGCDGILYGVSVVKISSLSSRPSRKGETWKENHRCRYQKIYYWHCSSNSRFVVSEKNKPGYGQKKEGGYAQNEKKKPSCGRCKKHLTKPSAFESEIHPSHKLRLCSVYFALAGGKPPPGG